MKLIFIIDSKDELDNQHILELIKKSKNSFFLFIKKNEYIQSMALSLINISIIDLSSDYNDLLVKSRKNIIEFFENFPHRPFNLNNNETTDFHNIFARKGFSAWWLTNFADKAPEAGGIVNRLFQLDIIKSILEKYNFAIGLIHTGDKRFAASVNSLFASRKISSFSYAEKDNVSSSRSKKKTKVERVEYKVRDIITDLFLIVRNAGRLIISKYLAAAAIILFKSRELKGRAAPTLSFHSWYPAHWHDFDEKYHDKYYFDLVDYVEKKSASVRPSYLFKLKWYDKNISGLFGSLKRLSGLKCEFDFLDRHILISDILKAYFDAFKMRINLNFAFASSRNKEIFQYNGIDIFQLAYFELGGSLIFDLPYNLVLAKALARYLKENKNIKAFVNFLELYACARGFINEIKSDAALCGTKMIAFQHSTITRYNLHYNYGETELASEFKAGLSALPEPDLFILSGKKAYETLDSYKINPQKLMVTGTPRYDFILNFVKRSENTGSAGINCSKILIATPGDYSESIEMINLCVESLCGHDQISLTIKMHPMCDISEGIARIFNSNEKYRNIKYELKKDNIYELIVTNDILITSNSMVGLEAIILGSNVVLYGDAFKINLSPLADSIEFRDRICYSIKQFKDNISKALAGGLVKPSSGTLKMLIEENYYKLDGLANERILKVLEGIIDEKN